MDVAIIGAGIVGLAHAWEAAKRGLSVTVFERSSRAEGASVRNFGMILPLGMAPGVMHERALRSRVLWHSLIREAGLWHQSRGAMVVAYHNDEQRALEEFVDWGPEHGYEVSWLNPKQVAEKNPVETRGLLGGIFSPTELLVDPREALRLIPQYLAAKFGVCFEFNAAVTGIAMPHVEAGGTSFKAERVIVCCGADMQTLFPQELAAYPVKKCKLQMMKLRAQPESWRLGPYLATGLSLTHYASFAACPSVADIKARMQAELPGLARWGIHILVAQNAPGELIVGDSHVYDDEVDPFDSEEINRLMLDQLSTFLNPPVTEIEARWHGIYVKTDTGAPLVLAPAPGVRIVTALGGGGMTTSFALAQDVFEGKVDG